MTRLTKALLLVGGVLLGLSQGYADDSCGYARDGACDEPLLCATDTDGTDCAGVPAEVRAGVTSDTAEAGNCRRVGPGHRFDCTTMSTPKPDRPNQQQK